MPLLLLPFREMAMPVMYGKASVMLRVREAFEGSSTLMERLRAPSTPAPREAATWKSSEVGGCIRVILRVLSVML
jgi:hypothetical protein